MRHTFTKIGDCPYCHYGIFEEDKFVRTVDGIYVHRSCAEKNNQRKMKMQGFRCIEKCCATCKHFNDDGDPGCCDYPDDGESPILHYSTEAKPNTVCDNWECRS